MKIGGNGWGKALWRHVSSDFMKDFLVFFPCENISCPNCRQVPNENQPTQKRRQKTLQKNKCQNFWAKKPSEKKKKSLLTLNIRLMWRSETGHQKKNCQKKWGLLTNLTHPSQFLSIFFSFSKKCQVLIRPWHLEIVSASYRPPCHGSCSKEYTLPP